MAILKRKNAYLYLAISLIMALSLLLMGSSGCPFGEEYELTTEVSPSNGGSVSPSGGSYDPGVTVTITAAAASGYEFDYWSGSASGTSPTTTIVMDADKSVIAHFAAIIQTHTLSVNVSPGDGGSVSPSGGNYDEGTSVTLTASAENGYEFDHWSGNASGTSPTTTVVMDADKTVTAIFVVSGPATLFSDDFSHDNGEWEVFSASEGEVFYEGGWLHLLNYTTSTYYTHSLSYQYFSDFALEVDTKLVSGTDDNWQGVLCRFGGSHDCYGLFISADGYYKISRLDDGTQTSITGAVYSSYINQGWDVVNTIGVEAVGNTLSLYVNGHFLDSITDNAYSSGYIGLVVSSLDGSYSEAAFDNMVITEPY